jgi:sugar-specific transcriptional regulator TrmB
MEKSDAKNLVKISKVSRQDVYRVLNELFEIGLIEKRLTAPTEFKAISIESCLGLLLERRTKKTDEIRKKANVTFENLRKKTTKIQSDEMSHLVLVPENEPILYKANDLIKSAKESVIFISPSRKVLTWLLNHPTLLKETLDTNVRLRFVTDHPENTDALEQIMKVLRERPFFEIRFLPLPPRVSFGVFDNKKLILELSATSEYLESKAIISDNSGLIELALNYFENKWNQSSMS